MKRIGDAPGTNKPKSIFIRLYNLDITVKILLVILAVFLVVGVLIAARLDRGIIPDETVHFGLSEAFATTWGIPADSPATYAYGPIGESPYFYYWINGRVLNLLALAFPSKGDWAQLLLLRFVNVIYSLLTLIFTYLIAKEIIKDRWWSLLVVFMLANTLMFTFLSAGVSYDNLVNLLCAISLYFLIKVFTNGAVFINSLLWLIFLCLGTLVKATVLPLVGLEFAIWLFFILRNRKKIFAGLSLTPKLAILSVVFLALLVFDTSIYGINVLMYGTITPGCTQILSVQQCNLNPVERRNADAQLATKVTAAEILVGSYPDPVDYGLTYWIPTMMSRIYGILGHKSFVPSLVTSTYMLFYIAVILIIAGKFRRPNFLLGSLFVVVIGYSLILFVVNYNTELSNGFEHLAVQGRYIFPVIGIAYSLAAYYLSRLRNRRVRISAYGATAVLFFITGPLLILTNYSAVFSSWFV